MSDTKSRHTERPPISRNTHPPKKADPGLSKESFSDFSQVITHRVGSLLSGIEGYTDLILSSLHSQEDRENAFRILESVSRINGVLSDLSHYKEALSLTLHLIRSNSIGAELLHILADSEVERLRVESKLTDKILIKADERLLRQALLSILRNAFEATKTDKLAVIFSIDTIHEGDVVRFKVFNPIPLTDAVVRKQMFDPFYTTKAANLGLGLTMARRIFRAHEGDVQLTSSELDAGTEITCTIPRSMV